MCVCICVAPTPKRHLTLALHSPTRPQGRNHSQRRSVNSTCALTGPAAPQELVAPLATRVTRRCCTMVTLSCCAPLEEAVHVWTLMLVA